jgi:hypothetical protein
MSEAIDKFAHNHFLKHDITNDNDAYNVNRMLNTSNKEN